MKVLAIVVALGIAVACTSTGQAPCATACVNKLQACDDPYATSDCSAVCGANSSQAVIDCIQNSSCDTLASTAGLICAGLEGGLADSAAE